MESGRGTNGQFAVGGPGGPGRPTRAVERQYLAAMGEVVSLELWQDIVRRAANDALAGDAVARTWLANYLVGRPTGEAPTLLLAHLDAELGIDRIEMRAQAAIDGEYDPR